MLLDDFLPTYDFNEIHSVLVHAYPQQVFDAIKRVTAAEMPLVQTLFAIRALPARFMRMGRGVEVVGTRAVLDQALNGGFVLLAEVADRELVLGTVGQFWSLRGGPSPALSTPEAFAPFNEAGYAKAAMNFYLEASANASVRLTTETRILALDPDSRRKFARYWRLIYPGSALIRRMWLQAIKRRAES